MEKSKNSFDSDSECMRFGTKKKRFFTLISYADKNSHRIWIKHNEMWLFV